MVDLHTHILPHLDDGAFDLETSVRMADLAARSGVFHMAATSHGNYYDYTLEEYRENFERLQAELRDREIPVKLYSGMEIFMDEKAADLLDLGELRTPPRTAAASELPPPIPAAVGINFRRSISTPEVT